MTHLDSHMTSRCNWRASAASLVVGAALTLVGCTSIDRRADDEASAPDPWHAFNLPGKSPTRYDRQHKQGVEAWHAHADRSASMWRRRLRVEPERLGLAHFSWWVPDLIESADLSRVEASDSPARVIFAFDGDRTRLSARNKAMFELAGLLTGEPPPYATLMYVWDPRAQNEQVLVSGRSDRVRKIVVESGPDQLRKWRHYRRDLRQDYRRAFGEEPGALIGVALMTDADNTASRAEAWYGEVRLD